MVPDRCRLGLRKRERPGSLCGRHKGGRGEPQNGPHQTVSRFRYTSRYAAGTMKTVITSETDMPPIIARASGAYASLPVPSLIAIGIRPMMVARDVIRIG